MKSKTMNIQLEPRTSNEFRKQITDYASNHILGSSTKGHEVSKRRVDCHVKRLLLYLFTATRGGHNRLKIVLYLAENPLNANQLAKELDVDYRSIQHHIAILKKNNMITCAGQKYGVVYFLSEFLELNIEAFNELIVKVSKNLE